MAVIQARQVAVLAEVKLYIVRTLGQDCVLSW